MAPLSLSTISGGMPFGALMGSAIAGAEPRYGTWSIWVPVIILNSSPARWVEFPMPPDAMLSLFGLVLAWAMRSGMLLMDSDGFTSATSGERVTLATGSMSRMKL